MEKPSKQEPAAADSKRGRKETSSHRSDPINPYFLELADSYYRHLDEAVEYEPTEDDFAKAEGILLNVFKQFNPESRDHDIGFYGATYDLNKIFCPELPPENIGSLEQQTVDHIEPLLESLEHDYPLAVQRFRWLFCDRDPWTPTDHTFDTSHYFSKRVEKRMLEHYTNLIETRPEEVADFALQAVGSGIHNEAGVQLIYELIQKKGWDFVISCALHPTVTFVGSKRRFRELKECIHKLGTPKNLPTEHVEALFAKTADDTEWVDLAAYVDRRKKAESLDEASDAFCRDLLRDQDIPFYDVEKTRNAAEALMAENYEMRYGLLEELRARLRAMWTEYDGAPDESTSYITNQMRKWDAMSNHDLLQDIYPVFAFNLIMAYAPDDEDVFGSFGPSIQAESEKGRLIQSLMLQSPELRKRAQNLISENEHAYFISLFESEFHGKNRYAAALNCSKDNLITPLTRHAKAEKRTGQDMWGYVINSSAMHLAHDTLALYSPTGRLLEVYRVDDEQKDIVDSRELAEFLNMKHSLSDIQNYTTAENVGALMVLFWNRLPEDWQVELRIFYDSFGIDIDDFVNQCPDSFELAANFTRDIAGPISHHPWFIQEFGRFVERTLKKFTKATRTPEPLDANHFLVLMNTEFGQTTLDEHAIETIFTNLSFDSTRYLQERLGVDLKDVSRREFFSLITFLRSQSGGVGFNMIHDFVNQAPDKKGRLDRVKSFLSLAYGTQMGDTIIAIGRDLPKVADRIFSKYAELIDAAGNLEDAIAEIFADKASPGHISSIQSTLTKKANDLLIRSHETLQVLQFQYEIQAGEGSLNRSFDTHADDNALAAYRQIESEEIEKLLTSLDSVRADIEMFKSAFRALYEEGVIESFGDVSGVEFGAKSPGELSDADKVTMRKMYDENYPESAGYSKEFREVIFRGLEEAFTKKDARFYVLKKDGEMLGYNRFEDLHDAEDGRKRKYVGSFNVSPQYRGSKLGDKIFDDCLAQEIVGDMIIEAYADPILPISSHYLETNGFVATGIEEVGGRPLLKIVRDGAMNARLATKKESPDKEELTRLAEEGVVALEKTARADMPAIASSKFAKGWLLTYISPDSKDKNIVTAVFEKPH